MAKSRVGSKEEDMGGIMGPQFTLLATQTKIIQVRLNFLKKFRGTMDQILRREEFTRESFDTKQDIWTLFGEQFMIRFVCLEVGQLDMHIAYIDWVEFGQFL